MLIGLNFLCNLFAISFTTFFHCCFTLPIRYGCSFGRRFMSLYYYSNHSRQAKLIRFSSGFIRNTRFNYSLLAELKTTLFALQAVLVDAEQKQFIDLPVKQWLDDLKDAIFDAEDFLDLISYNALRCKVENIQVDQLQDLHSSSIKINSKMEKMCKRLQTFVQIKDILGLQRTVIDRVSRRIPSSSVVNESVMVGRNDDKDSLINMLVSDCGTSRNNNLGVVAILGMGGVSKTTLAQLVYNDEKVEHHFDLKAWVYVSEDFDVVRVTKSLLESVVRNTSSSASKVWESNNLDILRVQLKKISREKRFLFVLDYLWNDNYNDWDELVSPLIDGKPGRKISRKCGGLPIAAKTLGGLLRSRVDTREWTAI